MPTRVFRRTPESEEAASYGYRDFLKDSISLFQEKATANVARMTSGGMSSEELQEIATAPMGGMLKVAGTSKLLAGLLARQGSLMKNLDVTLTPAQVIKAKERLFSSSTRIFLEALKVPEKEYGRIRNIKWSGMAGQPLGTKGLYDPPVREISLHPTLADIETVWHEFTHARQFNPERLSRLPRGQHEIAAAQRLGDLQNKLAELAQDVGISAGEFYRKISPTERHARGVARATVRFPKDFGILYKYALQNELGIATGRLDKIRNLK